MTADQEHLKCGTYAKDKNGCTIHFIRTIVLKEIILGELNKMISFVKENEDEFVQAAMDNSAQKQSSELAKSRKKLKESEKRIAELDRLFTRLYEDNVSGKISDERFAMMSAGYEDEQKKLRAAVAELTAYIDTAEQGYFMSRRNKVTDEERMAAVQEYLNGDGSYRSIAKKYGIAYERFRQFVIRVQTEGIESIKTKHTNKKYTAEI